MEFSGPLTGRELNSTVRDSYQLITEARDGDDIAMIGAAPAPEATSGAHAELLLSPASAPAAGLRPFGATTTISATNVTRDPAARRGYGDLDDRQARRRTHESFSGFLEDKGWADLRDQPRLRVRRYVGRDAAVVDVGGDRTLVRSLLPLRAGEGGRTPLFGPSAERAGWM